MNKEEISLTGKFLYTNPRANLTQTPPVIINKNYIETIKELQQNNFKLQQENKQLKERIDKAIEYNEHLIRDAKYHLNLGHLKKMRKILKGDSNG